MLFRGLLRRTRALLSERMILPVRSFPRGKSNQLPLAKYPSPIQAGRAGSHDVIQAIVTVLRVDRAGHLDPRDNQED